MLCILTFTMILSFNYSNIQANSANNEIQVLNESDNSLFIEFYSELEKDGIVLDSLGNDITYSFINRTKLLFKKNDYDSIKKIILDENLTLIKNSNIIQSRDITRRYSKDYYNLVNSTEGYLTIEITYRISGNATCNNSGTTIISYSNPVFTPLNSGWTATNVSCYATASGGTVTVNLSFVPTWYWPFNFEPFQKLFKGNKIYRTYNYSPGSY